MDLELPLVLAALRHHRNVVDLEALDRRQLVQLLRDGVDKRLNPLAGSRGDAEEGVSLLLHKLPEVFDLLLGGDVALVGHHNLVALGKLLAEIGQLSVDGLEILLRVAVLAAGDVHHMHNQAAPLHMAQKLVPEAHAVAGALDQSRDIGHDEGFFLRHLHHAQHRGQGGEVVVGDDRFGPADHRDQGRFSHIRIADQAHIGQEFELQNQLKALARQARLCIARDLAGRTCKVAVAPAALAAVRDDHRRLVGDVGHDLAALGVFDHRSHRHLDDQVRRALAVAAVAAAVLAVLRHKLALILEIHQRVDVLAALQHDVAAPAAVAAVRSARRHKLFPVEGHRAVAAGACLYPDGRFIDKHESSPLFPAVHCPASPPRGGSPAWKNPI